MKKNKIIENEHKSTHMIEMKNINKSYHMGNQQLHVLKDINFTVDKGEFVAILGPSGSGKSTLMNIIGCMDLADDGEYYLDDISVHNSKEKDMTDIRNQKIGFVFQNYQLISTYSVMQNVVMPLIVRGENYKKAVDESEEIVELLGLSDRLKHKPAELSGGQKQRVAIARALAGKPAVLLADEPTGALDTKSGEEVLKLFKKLNNMGNTIIMITHDLNVAKAAKRMVRIVDGELFSREDEPKEIQ